MLRRNIRAIVGCAIVFAVGAVVGIFFGAGGSTPHSTPRTVVTVETTVTVPPGGGSAAP